MVRTITMGACLMEKNDKLIKIIAIIMMIAGAIGILGWGFMYGVVAEAFAGEDIGGEMLSFYGMSISLGFIGSIIGIVAGIKIRSKKKQHPKTLIHLALLTSLMQLPGSLLFAVSLWLFAAIPAMLIGVAPPVVFMIKFYKLNKGTK